MPPQLLKSQKSNSHVSKKEWRRLNALVRFEEEARQKGFAAVVGIDEAGRGPLAGPVLAAACMIPADVFFPGINDCKQLPPKQREQLYEAITQEERVTYAIGMASHEDIDRINIYQATIQAMLQAVSCLTIIPDFMLVDGLSLPHPSIPSQKIISGDCLSQSIAAASVLAKVTRDRIMMDFHQQWPEYGFNQNKGYGTQQHLEALTRHGPCPIHRKSFEPIRSSILN